MLHGKKILGVCTSRIHSPLANTLIKTLDQKLRPHGYSIFAYTTNSDLFNNSPNDIGESSVFELMNYDVIDVLLVMCESFLNQPVLERIISRAQKHNVPVITFGGEFKGCIKPYFDYKAGMEQAGPVLLEPIGHLNVYVPDAYTGDIIGDNNKRRGQMLGMTPMEDNITLIEGEIPMAEMHTYASDLRSMTQARGSFTFTFERYQDAPQHITEKIIAESKKD